MATLESLEWNAIRECFHLPLMQVNEFGVRTMNTRHFEFI